MNVKAISLHQPWASLIAEGIKTIETRNWAPPKALIGQRIAIHAAKRKPTMNDMQLIPHRGIEVKIPGYFYQLATPTGQRGGVQVVTEPGRECPLGKMVATAKLIRALPVSEVRDGVAALYRPMTCRGPLPSCPYIQIDPYGDFSPGRWLWFLEDIEKLDPPVPAAGHQGFWNWTP